MRSSPEPQPGAAAAGEPLIGRFRIRNLLATGGMGLVYRATDPQLKREVALKLMRPELVASDSARTRFQRESTTAAQLDHPGLCPVYEVGEVDGQPFLVMPFLEGETLADRIAAAAASGEPIEDPERIGAVVRIVEAAARALHHAHGAGLVHRDIKPGNILVKDDGAPVVIDFGIACDAEGANAALTMTAQTPGTPLYMAPEQLRAGAGGIDARTDVYALGLTLYEALTLSPPFSGRTLHELFEQIRSQPTPNPGLRNRRISRDLQVVVEVATDKEPGRRYASCLEFAEDLRRCLVGEPVRARPLPAIARLGRWGRRNPAAAALLAILVAGLAVTVPMWFANTRLSVELADRAEAEQTQQLAATRLSDLVGERVERFDLLAAPVRLAGFRDEAAALLASGAADPAPLREWLDRFLAEGRPLLVKVDAALAELDRRAVRRDPVPVAAPVEQPIAHWLAQLRQRLLSLQAAARARSAPDDPVSPPSGIPADMPRIEMMSMLFATAMRECGPDRPLGRHSREGDFLDLTTRGLAFLGAGTRDHAACLVLHGWALFANGRDEGAIAAMQRAIAGAPADQRADFEWELEQLRRARREAAGELAETAELLGRIEPLVEMLRTRRLADAADQVLFEALVRVRIDAFTALATGGFVRRVEQQWRWLSALPELTEHHPGARASWAEAAAAVAAADGDAASPLYRERPIALRPQLGLVPIGKNPATGLWEFYDLRSALAEPDPEAARRLAIPQHRDDGSIDVGPDTGIVFVLLPGGLTRIGSQNENELAPNYDSDRKDKEPLMTGVVRPCFFARHELTQGQWLRLAGRAPFADGPGNPSVYAAGVCLRGCWFSLRHPVENVSWTESRDLLAAHGLRLPSEWEWERACRAGTATRFYTGPDAASLAGHENLLDATTLAVRSWRGERVPFDDGFLLHSPVGTFAANPWGLSDMHGNVSEFCSDPYSVTEDWITARGGRFAEDATMARASSRNGTGADGHSFAFGLRACRSLP